MITLRQLRYLTSLARHRHFGRAAEDCAVTQPALSMQLQQLEREIGAELVERRPGDIVLTDIGVEVAERAEQILAATRDLVDFARHRDVLSGQLRLGIIPTLAPYVLPRVLPQAAGGLSAPAAGGARDADHAAAGRAWPRRARCRRCWRCRPDGADVETLALFDDPFLLAVPADDPVPARGRVGVDDVDQSRLILLEEGHCLRDQALAFCGNPRRDQPAGLGATSLTTVMQMVANGYGVTLVPQVAVDAELRDARVKLLRFAEPEPARTIGLAWRRTSPRRKDFEALGKIVQETIRHREARAPARRAS